MAHCAPTSTTDLVAKKPMSGKEDAGTGFLALRLRSGFDKGLRIVGKGVAIALGLGSAGRYGREGLGDEGGREGLGDERGREGLGDEGGPGNDGRGGREMGEYELERRAGVEGRKGNFWGRVKRVVGGREGPVGLRRAEVRFLLE